MNATTTTTPCRRCKGRGFGDWVVQHGICYRCQGEGTEEAARRIKARADFDARMRDEVEDAYVTVEAARLLDAIHQFGTAFGVSPLRETEVEPGLWACTTRLHPDWAPPATGWLWEEETR